MREMAQANGAGNLRVEGFCTAGWLRAHLRPHAFIISDCEGYERELFCTSNVPQLATATMLIETHDAFVPGVRAAIVARFERTHLVEHVQSRAETPRPTLRVASLSAEELARVSQEVRPEQSWVLLTPKPSACAGPPRYTSLG